MDPKARRFLWNLILDLIMLFNMLSRLFITFLPRSKRLLISWLQSPSAVILELPKIKSVTVSTVSNQLPSSPDPESGVKEESTRGGHGKPPSSTPGLTAYLTAGPPRFRGFPRSGASAWEAAAPESRAANHALNPFLSAQGSGTPADTFLQQLNAIRRHKTSRLG